MRADRSGPGPRGRLQSAPLHEASAKPTASTSTATAGIDSALRLLGQSNRPLAGQRAQAGDGLLDSAVLSEESGDGQLAVADRAGQQCP